MKSTTSNVGDPGNAVLCSRNQTFQLRQVHSSNSVFLIQPSQDGSLIAISKCEVTLEAIPQSPPYQSLLKAALPVFSHEEQAEIPAPSEAQSKQAILVDTPVSLQEFNQAWIDLCAFEIEGRAWRPSSSMLSKVWKSILSASTIKGLSLDRALDVHSLASIVEEDDIPVPIFNAVMERLQDEKTAEQARMSRASRWLQNATKAR